MILGFVDRAGKIRSGAVTEVHRGRKAAIWVTFDNEKLGRQKAQRLSVMGDYVFTVA